jgi:hypothetical protein
MRMRRTPRTQLEINLSSLVKAGNSTNIRLDALSEAQIKERILAIRFWDSLYKLVCPLCETYGEIKLDSQANRSVNLVCTHCSARYEMSLSRSLGARLVIRP